MKRQPGDVVKLRVSWGFVPEPGDVLLFPSGRRLQVFRVGGTKTLHCWVMAIDEEGPGRTLEWRWAPRKRRGKG